MMLRNFEGRGQIANKMECKVNRRAATYGCTGIIEGADRLMNKRRYSLGSFRNEILLYLAMKGTWTSHDAIKLYTYWPRFTII